MADEKNNGDGKDGEAIAKIGVAALAILFLIRFFVPIALGFIFSTLARMGTSYTRSVHKIRSLTIITLNYMLLLYLFTGFPVDLRIKNQFMGIFGDAGVTFIRGLVAKWNDHWADHSFIRQYATIEHLNWIRFSQEVWASLIAAAVFFVVSDLIKFFFDKSKKENPFEKKLNVEPQSASGAETVANIAAFPTFQLLKIISFRQAAHGHDYAISLRQGNLWFVKKMLIECGLTFLICIPVLFTTAQTNDFTLFLTMVLTVPFFSLTGAFVIGLIPKVGEFINGVVFYSPHGHTDLSALNPLAKKREERQGFYLGNTHNGSNYMLTEKNLNHHVQIVAPSGGGKTNIIKNFIFDRIEKGHGIIFLDYKADFEVAEFIYKSAKYAKRSDEVRIFSLSNREISVPYNPLSHGSAAELQSRLVNAFNWSEIYYKSKAESTLLKVFRGLTELRDLKGKVITIKTVFDVLSKKGLARELSVELKSAKGTEWEALEDVATMLDRPSDAKELQGLITNLEKVIYSGAGELLTKDASEKAFTIEEAIDQGLITYFLMNSMSSKETATSVGKLLLQDMMGYVGRAYDKGVQGRKPITIIIDEFAEFAIPEFPSFLNRVRGAGIGVMIAHQTRGDLRAVSDDYLNKIEANTNTKIVAGVIDPDDADFYAKLVGTQTVQKETEQVVEENFLLMRSSFKTGQKSVRDVEEYIIHPNIIKRIEQGEAFVISRTVDTGFGLVGVPRSHDMSGIGISRDQIEGQLKLIRKRYLPVALPGLTTSMKINTPELSSNKKLSWED